MAVLRRATPQAAEHGECDRLRPVRERQPVAPTPRKRRRGAKYPALQARDGICMSPEYAVFCAEHGGTKRGLTAYATS